MFQEVHPEIVIKYDDNQTSKTIIPFSLNTTTYCNIIYSITDEDANTSFPTSAVPLNISFDPNTLKISVTPLSNYNYSCPIYYTLIINGIISNGLN